MIGLFGQGREFTRVFQLSLTPGLSTNGLQGGAYTNYFSLNLTSGYSYANRVLEIGLISNLNEKETHGMQFAGLANVTGANAFAGLDKEEIQKKLRQGYEMNLSGAQFAGLANVVALNVFGMQASGGVNLAKGALLGFQAAGVSNTVLQYSFGAQLAGLYNVSTQSMTGAQVSGLFNFTDGSLFGVQLGAMNRAKRMDGKNSFEGNDELGIQIGLINSASTMNGYQIGLINIAGRSQGTQIGLINIFRSGKDPLTRDGSSFGLLNIGTSGYLGVYTSDTFLFNYEIVSGSVNNRRIPSDPTTRKVLNSLIYSVNPDFLQGRDKWAIGYGLQKAYFNRSTIPRHSGFWFLSYGVDFLHISHEAKKLTKELSLLTRPGISIGSRLFPKNYVFYLFAAAHYNIYASKSGMPASGLIEQGRSEKVQHWPGFSFGVLIGD